MLLSFHSSCLLLQNKKSLCFFCSECIHPKPPCVPFFSDSIIHAPILFLVYSSFFFVLSFHLSLSVAACCFEMPSWVFFLLLLARLFFCCRNLCAPLLMLTQYTHSLLLASRAHKKNIHTLCCFFARCPFFRRGPRSAPMTLESRGSSVSFD